MCYAEWKTNESNPITVPHHTSFSNSTVIGSHTHFENNGFFSSLTFFKHLTKRWTAKMKIELNIVLGVECPINLIIEITLLFRSVCCRWITSTSSNIYNCLGNFVRENYTHKNPFLLFLKFSNSQYENDHM